MYKPMIYSIYTYIYYNYYYKYIIENYKMSFVHISSIRETSSIDYFLAIIDISDKISCY